MRFRGLTFLALSSNWSGHSTLTAAVQVQILLGLFGDAYSNLTNMAQTVNLIIQKASCTKCDTYSNYFFYQADDKEVS